MLRSLEVDRHVRHEFIQAARSVSPRQCHGGLLHRGHPSARISPRSFAVCRRAANRRFLAPSGVEKLRFSMPAGAVLSKVDDSVIRAITREFPWIGLLVDRAHLRAELLGIA
jgi:hypothetical protein